ncbi:MAG: GNAT family N-acetyltransferase [Chitinophagaceae bacterium]|nr:GNAT family N-acetyltransferase [Chitinophagaceae bacterium]
MEDYKIRPIQPEDNKTIASVIRDTLVEFGANHPGTVFFDPTTDHLFELFRKEKAAYWIVEDGTGIVGGGGIFPTKGLPADTCELVKLYLLPRARGKGLGKKLIEICHQEAKKNGFRKIYLETMPELTIAVPLYEKFGYQYLDGPLGESGHFGCAIQMLKTL